MLLSRPGLTFSETTMAPFPKSSRARRPGGFTVVCAAVVACAALGRVGAQEAPEKAEDPRAALVRSIHWQQGPCNGSLGSYAEIAVPEGFVFAGPADAQKFMELNENVPDPGTMGAIVPVADGEDWFLVFEYLDTGHVPDDEKATIDADALLKHKREAEGRANEERRKRGFPAMHCKDWLIPPAYDSDTKSLAWALRLESGGETGQTHEVCNYNLRILGRTGVMSTTLVCNPADITRLAPQVKSLLKGHQFVTGQRYAEWREGEKLAAYGLTGLITGGAAVAAIKSGFFAKLVAGAAKMGKLVVVAVMAAVAGLWKLLFGRKERASAE